MTSRRCSLAFVGPLVIASILCVSSIRAHPTCKNVSRACNYTIYNFLGIPTGCCKLLGSAPDAGPAPEGAEPDSIPRVGACGRKFDFILPGFGCVVPVHPLTPCGSLVDYLCDKR
jgi:hypothetical protein